MAQTSEVIAAPETGKSDVYGELSTLQVEDLTPKDQANAEFQSLPEEAAKFPASPTFETPVSSTFQLPVSESAGEAVMPESVSAAPVSSLFDQVLPPDPGAVAQKSHVPVAEVPASESTPAPAKASWREKLANLLGFGRKKVVEVDAEPLPPVAPVEQSISSGSSKDSTSELQLQEPATIATPIPESIIAPISPEVLDAIRSAADATLALWHQFVSAQPMERQRLVRDWITVVSQLSEDQWSVLVERLGSTEPRIQAVVAESQVHLFAMIAERCLLSPPVIESLLPADIIADQSKVEDLEVNAAERFGAGLVQIQKLLNGESPDSSEINRVVRTVFFAYAKLTSDQREKLTQHELSPEPGTEGQTISWTDALGTLTELLLASEPQQASSS